MNSMNLLSKLSEEERKSLFDLYATYSKSFARVKYVAFAILGLVLVYNLFFAGNRYTISEYNTIRNTFALTAAGILIVLIIISILVFKTQATVKKELKGLASKYSIAYKPLKKEFNAFIKSQAGGVPV